MSTRASHPSCGVGIQNLPFFVAKQLEPFQPWCLKMGKGPSARVIFGDPIEMAERN